MTGQKKDVATAKKKFAARAKNDVDVMIKVKDEDGKIVEFEKDAGAVPKKKKKVAKTTRAANDGKNEKGKPSAIEAEDTLAMIKSALKSGAGKLVGEFGDVMDNDSTVKKKSKKQPATKKKKELKPAKIDEERN